MPQDNTPSCAALPDIDCMSAAAGVAMLSLLLVSFGWSLHACRVQCIKAFTIFCVQVQTNKAL